MSRGKLLRVADAAEMARVAAGEILRRAGEALERRGVFHLALSGGSTPRATYAELARRRADGDWGRWHVWFSDERCVPPTHAESNYRMACEAWLANGSIGEERIHRLRGEARDVAGEAARYESELVRHLGDEARLDLALLGLGEDAHVASLFPGSPTLAETARLILPARAPKPPHERLTLTLVTLNAARAVSVLVSGDAKARALLASRSERADRSTPATLVNPESGELSWIADAAAAREA